MTANQTTKRLVSRSHVETRFYFKYTEITLQTLGVLYQLMNDLPPDILLYFLTMVPLPEGPMNNTSTLIELMKQMHSTNLLNK